MNTPSQQRYTNEASPELLRTLDQSPFTELLLANFGEEALAIIEQQQSYVRAHPPVAIYRVATEGSQTRNGGVIQHATAPMEFTLDTRLAARRETATEWSQWRASKPASARWA